MSDRLSRHICDTKRGGYNSILHNSIRKYGDEYFTIGEVESCSSLEELNEREIYWINETKPSLNIQRGGKNSGKHSNTSISLMSRKAKERWNSYSPEERQTIKDNHRIAHSTERYRNLPVWQDMVKKKGSSITITNINTGETIRYYSMRECERDGWSRATITRSIKTNKPIKRRIDGQTYQVRKEDDECLRTTSIAQ